MLALLQEQATPDQSDARTERRRSSRMTGLQNNAVADNAGAGSDSIGSQPHIGTLQRMVPYVSFAFVMTPASFKQKPTSATMTTPVTNNRTVVCCSCLLQHDTYTTDVITVSSVAHSPEDQCMYAAALACSECQGVNHASTLHQDDHGVDCLTCVFSRL